MYGLWVPPRIDTKRISFSRFLSNDVLLNQFYVTLRCFNNGIIDGGQRRTLPTHPTVHTIKRCSSHTRSAALELCGVSGKTAYPPDPQPVSTAPSCRQSSCCRLLAGSVVFALSAPSIHGRGVCRTQHPLSVQALRAFGVSLAPAFGTRFPHSILLSGPMFGELLGTRLSG